MYLFLKLNDVEKVISGIALDNDCVPLVEGLVVAPTSASDRQSMAVNCIPWFKSLAIDAVYIDCGYRDCRWVPKMFTVQTHEMSTKEILQPGLGDGQSEAFFPISARPIFRHGGEMSDFDPIADELYERAEGILSSVSKKGMSEEELRTECAQLLHCCVFPIVEFSKTDVPVLKGCSQRIALRIQALEEEIQEKEAELVVTEGLLSKRKSKILANEHLCDEAHVKACTPSFLHAMYDSLAADIQEAYTQVEVRQRKVQEERKRSQNSKVLEGLVRDRDAAHQQLQKLLIVRETIRTVLDSTPSSSASSRKTRKMSKEEKGSYTMLVKIYEEMKSIKCEVTRLCYRRLHCTAIKKAIDATVMKIDSGKVESVCDFSEFSLSVGVAGGGDSWSGWRSMQDQVNDVMEKRNSIVYYEHVKRCQFVLDLASSVFSEQVILEPEKGDVLEDSGEDCLDKASYTTKAEGVESEKERNNDGADFWRQARNKAVQAALDHMVEVASTQMMNMATVIVLHLGLDADNVRYVRRAWVCYSPHFFHVTLSQLQHVYARLHSAHGAEMHAIVTSLALTDIVDERFFEDFFVGNLDWKPQGGDREDGVAGQGAAGEDLTPAGSMESLSSLTLVTDLRRCSVGELYALVDKDCQKLCKQMEELEHMEMLSGSLSSKSSSSSNSSGRAEVGDTDAKSEGKGHDSDSSSSSSSSGDAESHSEEVALQQLKKRASALVFVTSKTQRQRSVSSLLAAVDGVIAPFNALMQRVVDSPDLLEKLRLLGQGVSFLAQQVELHCHDKGMDSLLPMSLFATVCLKRDLFISLFTQLQLLNDFRHHVVLPAVYDFGLTSAYTPYFFLSERKKNLRKTESDA